jgi:hypothetical protein
VQDEPEHRETNASERRKKESAVEPHRELAGWAPGTCLGDACRTPDRFFTKRPETAPTDSSPTRRASCCSRVVPALPWAGVLDERIDIRTVQVVKIDGTRLSRTVEPVRIATLGSEDLIAPTSSQSVVVRSPSHSISFGGIKDLRCCQNGCAGNAVGSEPEWVNCMTNSGRFCVKGAKSVRVQLFGLPRLRTRSISSDWLPTPSCR